MSYRDSYLDGEQIFKKWASMGKAKSWLKMQKWARAENIFNPVTGKRPYRMTLFKAAWRWAWHHQDEARKLAVTALDAEDWDDTRWKFEFLDKAASAYQNPRYIRALEEFKAKHPKYQ